MSTLSLYRREAATVLGLAWLQDGCLNLWHHRAINSLTALLLAATNTPDQTPPATLVPLVHLRLSGGLSRTVDHLTTLADRPVDPACPLSVFLHRHTRALQTCPELERDTILRFIRGHLTLAADLGRFSRGPAVPAFPAERTLP